MLPWQQYSRCHFVSFVMYITGAKVEDHCSNISGDIQGSRLTFEVASPVAGDRFDSRAKTNLNIQTFKYPLSHHQVK